MKKTTSGNLSKKIARYGALTVIIAGATDASGQIIYTDINPDEGGSGVLYVLDMDADSNSDFGVRHINQTAAGMPVNRLLALIPVDSNSIALSNSILASTNSSYVYPLALNAGDNISASNALWNNSAIQTMNFSSCSFYYSNWCGETDKYLGLRFKIGTNTHYGWARLDVGLNPTNWVIKDYAYNSVADASITAGQMPLGLKNTLADQVEIVGLNKTIALYHLPGNTSYRIINMTGQSVLEGSTADNSFVIQNESLKTGVYVVELIDVNTGDTMSKKVLL